MERIGGGLGDRRPAMKLRAPSLHSTARLHPPTSKSGGVLRRRVNKLGLSSEKNPGRENIRNFAIIAHIDAGKSTLSDRLLELTGTVASVGEKNQLLDSNPIERERGITIKLAPVTMRWRPRQKLTANGGDEYILNLIDTPGHVDFSYEVERSLAAGEGAILLIDGTRGIQAQTISHAEKALGLKLAVVPAINKIDLPGADVENCLTQLTATFGFDPNDVSLISAKNGRGVQPLLQRVVEKVPAPKGNSGGDLRALVFNSVYDEHLGVIAFVRVVDGTLAADSSLRFLKINQEIIPREIGILKPDRTAADHLGGGCIGYIATGLKDIRQVKIGDTVVSRQDGRQPSAIIPLPGYQEPKPMVFSDFYPQDASYQELSEAVDKLRLSDASLTAAPVHSPILGAGVRLGFLGIFHIEITKERLQREHGVNTFLTSPTVSYRISLTNGRELTINHPSELPDPSRIAAIREPVVKAIVLTPPAGVGPLMQILEERRGAYLDTRYLGRQAQLIYELPLIELISGLIDQLKSASSGFATLDYQLSGWKMVEAVKLVILVNNQEIEALAKIVTRREADRIGRKIVARLKEILPPQMFAMPIQAAVGGRIIARETKRAYRKDVTAKLYGGDQTRKDKLLEKQKKGKKRRAKMGRVSIPDSVLFKMATGQY